jgi:hypothetical protein
VTLVEQLDLVSNFLSVARAKLAVLERFDGVVDAVTDNQEGGGRS